MSDFSNARVLRVIGQDLETRGLKTFDIRFAGDRYKASCGYQAPPAPTPVTLEYTMDDIDELERQGQSRRSENPAQLDLLTLSQLLRSLGGYLDSKSINLSRLTNNESAGAEAVFKIEGKTARGERLVEERNAATIYDMGVTMYKQRGKLAGVAARYAHWRR
jgi:hypothetical protein